MPDSDITIEQVDAVSPELVQAFAHLMPQLSSGPPADRDRLQRIVDDHDTVLFCAHDREGEIVGTLCLVVFEIPTGRRAWIEDVVVDESTRGKGVGAALVNEALTTASVRGACSVDLTSRPSRIEANRLYERLGFVRRETNVWRYSSPALPAD